jgi:hypothetical protein
MVQAIAEGGMEEMSDQRIEARFGGSIRQQYGLGSIVKGIVGGAASAVKGVTNAVKSVVKSPIGKAALAAAAIYFGGPALSSALGGPSSWLGTAALGPELGGAATQGILGFGGQFAPMSGALASGISNLIPSSFSNLMPTGVGDLVSKYGTSTLISGAAGALGGALAGGMPQQQPGESNEDYQARVDQWKVTLNQGLSNPTLSITNSPLNLYPNNPFYAQRRANGGRIGYGFGSLVSSLSSNSGVAQPVSGGSINSSSGLGGLFGGIISKLIQQNPAIISQMQSSPVSTPSPNGISDIVKQTTKQTFFGNVKPMYDYNLQDLYNARKENNDYMYANGGRIGYAAGNIPVRKNEAGVKELDYRDTGGFVPPIGIKERADDIPAMLSNNEFVFTADAVRNAGGGDENLGAQRMYRLMKKLEHGGRV